MQALSSVDDMSVFEAKQILEQLLTHPVAPKEYAWLMNAGTDSVLNKLEEHYFASQLANGAAAFKYLEGDYGAGKSQFIYSLTKRAHEREIVAAVVEVGNECPFNSPLAIFQSVMASFVPPSSLNDRQGRGIVDLIDAWIGRKLRSFGIESGAPIDASVKDQLMRPFTGRIHGARDPQMAYGLQALGRRLVEQRAGAAQTTLDRILESWVLGQKTTDASLKKTYGLSASADDTNAFHRLMTSVGFLRNYMGFRGMLLAFDEGTRTASFRRGSIKQKQAIENMLTMINSNGGNEFAGVLFVYAATPDFKTEVVNKYIALHDRIGTHAMSEATPQVPLIDLGVLNSRRVVLDIGKRLVEIGQHATEVTWNETRQNANLEHLHEAVHRQYYAVSPRTYVGAVVRFVWDQINHGERELTADDAGDWVQSAATITSEED
jgi:hypothetical protein